MSDRKGQADEPGAAEPAPEHEQVDELREYVPADILDVSFPQAVRGYDRRAVDAYVKRVNRLIAEVKVTASPRAAVKHALHQTEQQVAGLLERARETADEITTGAKHDAEEEASRVKASAAQVLVNANAEAEDVKAEAQRILDEAKREAEEILVRSRLQADETVAHAQTTADERFERLEADLETLRSEAEVRVRELDSDTAKVWQHRRQLLEDIHVTASKLVDVADKAAAREPEAPDVLEALRQKTRATTPGGSQAGDEASEDGSAQTAIEEPSGR